MTTTTRGMTIQINANPILPVPGVDRSLATNSGASRNISPGRQNDDVTVNRLRGVTSDRSQRKEAVLRCGQRLLVGTHNVNTLRNENRAAELARCRNETDIEILGVQEHRIIHADPIEFKRLGSSYLVTSSGWRNEVQASQGGVGLLMGTKARKALLKVKSINKRIMLAEFDGNPKTSVIVVYAPTNCSSNEKAEEFFEELNNTISDIPAHNFLIVMGDFNARLGSDQGRYTYHEETNRNGKHMADLLAEHGLLATNTMFQKKKGKLWTFKDRASDALRQLDYILVRKKWRNSVHNTEAFNSFNTVGSDHRVVSSKLKLSLRVPRKTKKISYDWKLFSKSTELQHQYTIAVKNKYQVLEVDSNDERFCKFVDANKSTMEESVPKKSRKKPVLRSSDPTVVEARKEAEKAHMEWEANRNEQN